MRHGGYRSSRLIYQNKEHVEPVFVVNGTPRFFEKLYIENDECDGIVWEKEHSRDIILGVTSWYPGYYSSTSFASKSLRLQDPRMPYVQNTIGAEVYQRSKDFVIAKWGTYYYHTTGEYQVSKDGLTWTKQKTGAPSNWMSAIIGWGIKNNDGVCEYEGKIYKMSISDEGILTWTAVRNSTGQGGSYCGDIVSQGIVQDGTHRWYQFANAQGELYTSKLPDHYTYFYEDMWGSVSVQDGSYQWSFYYLNGKYIAFTTNKINRIKAYSASNYEYWYDVLYVESDDGFKTIRSRYFEQPRLTYAYQWTKLFYFNGKFLLYERGETVTPGSGARTPYLHIYDFGKSFFNTPTMINVPQTYTVPLVGLYRDQNVDTVTVQTYGSVSPGARNYVRSFDGFGSGSVYIRDGKPSEPFGGVLIPTAFKPNGWSSNSYDEGGFIYIDGAFLKAPKRGIAFGTNEYMVDRMNATWGEDYYHFRFRGPAGMRVRVQELNQSYQPYTYTVTIGQNDKVDKMLKFHTGGKTVRVTFLAEEPVVYEKQIRNGVNLFYYQNPETLWITGSPYYMEGTGAFTSYSGRTFSKVNAGSAYCFAEYNSKIGWTEPLIISDAELPTDYSPSGGVKANIVTDQNDKDWYYRGFSYSVQGNYRNAARYIDTSACGSTEYDDIVLYILRQIYRI